MPRPGTGSLSHCSTLIRPCYFCHPPRAPYASCAFLSAQEYQVMTDIMLFQVDAENYTLEPEDPFRDWFQAMEPLSEAKR